LVIDLAVYVLTFFILDFTIVVIPFEHTGTHTSDEQGQIVWDTVGAHSHSGCSRLQVLFYLVCENQ